MRLRSAGILRHRVSIEQRGAGLNSFGEPSGAWASLGTFWAEVSPLSMRESLMAKQVASEVTHRVTLRYQSIFAAPLTAGAYRVIFGARVLDVDACINEGGRGVFVVLLCKEGLSQG